MTVMGIFIAVAEMNYEELYPSNTKALILVAGMYVVVFLGVAIKLVNQFQSNQIEIQKLKSEKIEAELKFLKAQLHPHFLFNTLNNLYSLTLEKSEKAPDVVLKPDVRYESLMTIGKPWSLPSRFPAASRSSAFFARRNASSSFSVTKALIRLSYLRIRA
jgi:hypothetical protein